MYTLHVPSTLPPADYVKILQSFQEEGWSITPLPRPSGQLLGSLRLSAPANAKVPHILQDYQDKNKDKEIFLVDHNENAGKTLTPRLQYHASPNASLGPYFYANKLASIYQLAPTPGNRVNIAIISLGGGFKASDLKLYWASENLGATTPNVYSVSVDGAKNSPGSDADIENLLDIQVCGSMTPNSNIYVYFAPNSDVGFYDAVYSAVHSSIPFSVISISWGAPEAFWSTSYLKSMNTLFQTAAAKGITICAAAGDNGSSDGLPGNNVDFPASSPYVLACGGTRLTCPSNVYARTSTTETVWGGNNTHGATGGGFSRVFARPISQYSMITARTSGRGVPDVAGNADPYTGWIIAANGSLVSVGGTSAVAPMWAGYLAGLRLKKSVLSVLYKAPAYAFHDVTSGSNGAYSGALRWDPCTGLGTPSGAALTAYLRANAV